LKKEAYKLEEGGVDDCTTVTEGGGTDSPKQKIQKRKD
jgi:hypothetical protein